MPRKKDHEQRSMLTSASAPAISIATQEEVVEEIIGGSGPAPDASSSDHSGSIEESIAGSQGSATAEEVSEDSAIQGAVREQAEAPTPLPDDAVITIRGLDREGYEVDTVGKLRELYSIEGNITREDIERIESVLEAIAQKMNIRPQDVVSFSQEALANYSVLAFRPVNPAVRAKLEQGAEGKGFATKSKSADSHSGPILEGFIPRYSVDSKLGFREALHYEGHNPVLLKDRTLAIMDMLTNQAKTVHKLHDDHETIAEVTRFIEYVRSQPELAYTKQVNDDGSVILKAGEAQVTLPPSMAVGNKDLISQAEHPISKATLVDELNAGLTQIHISSPATIICEGEEHEIIRLRIPFSEQEIRAALNPVDGDSEILIADKARLRALVDSAEIAQAAAKPLIDENGIAIDLIKKEDGTYWKIDKEGNILEQFETPEGAIEYKVEILKYQKYSIELNTENEIEFSEAGVAEITADYDPLAYATIVEAKKSSLVGKDHIGRFGLGTEQSFDFAEAIRAANPQVVRHGFEQRNPFPEKFTDEVYPTFLYGIVDPREFAKTDELSNFLLRQQEENLIATIFKTGTDATIDPDTGQEKFMTDLAAFVAFPSGQREVAEIFAAAVRNDFHLDLNLKWINNPNFDQELWYGIFRDDTREATFENTAASIRGVQKAARKFLHRTTGEKTAKTSEDPETHFTIEVESALERHGSQAIQMEEAMQAARAQLADQASRTLEAKEDQIRWRKSVAQLSTADPSAPEQTSR